MKNLILRTLDIDFEHKHFHLPGSLSALPLIAGIYERMNFEHDVFILSKGHSCAAWYAVLESHGFTPDVSRIHPERDPINGILCTAGSLGHGLPMAVGIALAKKLKGEPGKVNVLMGDGECMEGTTDESIRMAGGWKLNNLNIEVDGNGTGCLADLPFDTRWIVNLANLNGIPMTWNHTVKGKGIPSIEGTKDHVLAYDVERYRSFRKEVEAL